MRAHRSTRFLNIAFTRRLARIKQPNIVAVQGACESDKSLAGVCDYQSAGCLMDRRLKPFHIEQFLPLDQDLYAGLSKAHNWASTTVTCANNIFFDSHGRVCIADADLSPHYDPSIQEALSKNLRQPYWCPINRHRPMAISMFWAFNFFACSWAAPLSA